MKINVKQTLKNLRGEALKNEDKEPVTVGEVVSNILLANKAGGKMKMFILAKKFFEGSNIEVDKADFSMIKKAIEETEIYGPMVSGQLLVLWDGLEEKETKK